MSRFLKKIYREMKPYVPGEQPQQGKFVKLNTNENPYPPCPAIEKIMFSSEAEKLRLYSDPSLKNATEAIAKYYELNTSNVIVTNGSDEVLAFIYMAFFEENNPVIAPDISYGFFPVYSALCNLEYKTIPLKADFSLDVEAFAKARGPVIFANPNAPTGLAISKSQVEYILKNNKNLVVVDEAYVDFGAETAAALVEKYDNLIVTQTLSKSRSLAGARIGFALANESIIEDLNKMKFSFNPYNVNRLSDKFAKLAFEDVEYFKRNCETIIKTRRYLISELRALEFEVLESKANFILVRPFGIDAKAYYEKLKQKNILIRYFEKERLEEYVRITIGSLDDVKTLIHATKDILLGCIKK